MASHFRIVNIFKITLIIFPPLLQNGASRAPPACSAKSSIHIYKWRCVGWLHMFCAPVQAGSRRITWTNYLLMLYKMVDEIFVMMYEIIYVTLNGKHLYTCFFRICTKRNFWYIYARKQIVIMFITCCNYKKVLKTKNINRHIPFIGKMQ